MEIIAITGGKGGTGKSTVATSLARELSKDHKVLLVDADVDCPNNHLILDIKRRLSKIVKQRIPKFDMNKCTNCGNCGKICKSNAIVSIKKKNPIFIENQCNGCGACKIICPSNAITWSYKEIGKIYFNKKGKLDLLSGELKTNQPVSEFIVNHLNEDLEKLKEKYDYAIIDTAAGTHCPVITALEKADSVLAVTEPTPLGSHDLELILQLLSKLKKKSKIILNKSDLGVKENIKSLSLKYKTKIILEIPYSRKIVKSYSQGTQISIPKIKLLVNK
jgi:MinD superfamily P-loop ATPase